MSLAAIFLVIALVLFVLAAVGVSTPHVNLTAAGLAFVAGAMLVGSLAVG